MKRRSFLINAGASILATPVLATLKLPNLSFPESVDFSSTPIGNTADRVFPIDNTLERLLEQRHGSNPFVAHAASGLFDPLDGVRLFESPEALDAIYDSLGISKRHDQTVNYDEAKQCEPNFNQHEQEFRANGYDSFTDVERSPRDRDVAYMGAQQTMNPRRSVGATQFRDYSSVELTDYDPGVVVAATSLLRRDYVPTPKEIAQSFAVTNKRRWSSKDGRRGRVYETPVHIIVHDHTPNPAYNRGVLAVHNKRLGGDNVYFRGLYV